MHYAATMIDHGTVVKPTVSRLLAGEHARLDALFDDACTCAGACDFVGAIGAFHAFAHGLAHHIELEERFLFPVFDARAGMLGPTTVMRHEHRALEQLLALAAASLQARDGGQFAAEAAELAALVRAHNLKEERILYPRTDAALDDVERAELVAALERA